METPIDNSFEQAMQEPKRPQFLTVICVLSFIMCGLALLGGVWNMIQSSPEHIAESVEKMRQFSPEMADQFEQRMADIQENTFMQISQYLGFIYTLISFMGVLMMWKLQRKGFFVYVAGELLFYLGFIFAGKEMMSAMSGGGTMEGVGLAVVAMMVVFDAVFIIMYAVNLKHMK